MALSSSQQKQLGNIKKQAEAIQAKLGPRKSSGDLINEGYAKALAGKNSGVNTASSAPAPAPAPAPTNVASTAPAPYSYKPDTGKTDKFYNSLLESMKPSRDETNLQDQQSALDAELRDLRTGQGISNQNIADQTIPMSFITGQQASVENRYALKRGDVLNRQQTLQAKLANLQARRQSAMDVSKVGLEYTQGQESQAEKIARQQYEDSISNSRYSDSQTQQQYENTNRQTQQTLDNTYRQSQANIDNAYRQSQANKPSSTVSSEEKQITAFQADAAKYIEGLGSNKISWGTAFNALKAKYPQASNELIDQMLGKDRYYTVQGTGGGRSV